MGLGQRIAGGRRQTVDTGQAECAVGPSLSVALMEQDQTTSWRIDVDVDLAKASLRLGSVVTVPGGIQGPKSRIVAMAYAPGAVRWRVHVERFAGADPNVQGEVEIATSECCSGTFGLVAREPFSTLLDQSQRDTELGAFASRVVTLAPLGIAFIPVPGTIEGFNVTNTDAAVRFFQLHASAVALGGGELPLDVFAVPPGTTLTRGRDYFGESGRLFAPALCWGWSTTAPLFTAAALGNHVVVVNWR